eukprot:TRINITY_DN10238_c0_g1_i2.p1 TRINITY_DN10238_c0_g1~~TRINITY_DN10238_c0_g1_i2.p1  ORF type:complete len:105 (-),score=15.81 TRINITY_DN10238_c0_g1_i2:158-472(-)
MQKIIERILKVQRELHAVLRDKANWANDTDKSIQYNSEADTKILKLKSEIEALKTKLAEYGMSVKDTAYSSHEPVSERTPQSKDLSYSIHKVFCVLMIGEKTAD